MARLETTDGGWLELTPVGFQFAKGDPYNWLNIEFLCDFGDRRRRPTIDPAFTISELRSLVSWIRRVLDGTLEVRNHFMGIEPNFQLRLLAYRPRSVELEIWLEQEWHLRPAGLTEPVVAAVTRHRLKIFADELQSNVHDFSEGRRAILSRRQVRQSPDSP